MPRLILTTATLPETWRNWLRRIPGAKRLADWARGYGAGKNHNPPLLPLLSVRWREAFSRNRICVFHHIPKCAGSTVVNILGTWFFVVEDYRALADGQFQAGKKLNLNRLTNWHCLSGHFDCEGIYLHQRYPEVLADRRFFLITFVRDPLATRISLFFYEKKWGRNCEATIEEHLLRQDNHIATCLDCNENDYHQVLDRYDFIGVTERMDESITRLAEILGKKKGAIPFFNPTARDLQPPEIRPAVLEEFRRRNALDYAIYRYALQRLGLADAQSSSSP